MRNKYKWTEMSTFIINRYKSQNVSANQNIFYMLLNNYLLAFLLTSSMINNSPSRGSALTSRAKHQIYISSIGKLWGRDLSCHVKKEEKELLFEPKIPTLPKVLFKIFSNLQQNVFHQITKFTATKKKHPNTIFLPGVFLTNDIEAMKSYKQKLATTQVDKYISLNIPVKRPQSLRMDRSCANETTTQKDVDSTYLDNRQKSSYYSRSIDNTKLGSKLRVSDIRVTEYDEGSSRSRISKSRTKRDIIHIKYTQTLLGSAKTQQTKKITQDQRRSQTIKIKEFRIDDICEITEKMRVEAITDRRVKQATSRKTNHKYESMMVEESRSPYIGKNRVTRAVNYFEGKEFLNIDIDC